MSYKDFVRFRSIKYIENVERRNCMARRFSEDFLNELRSRCDLETVASRYIELKKRGNNVLALCPFHGEKTPSFNINPTKQLFYCFGCGAGGDVITFIMKIENLSYAEAVAFLAEQAGMELPPEDNYESELSYLRKRILEMNRLAARFYYDKLISKEGAAALSYLKNRQLSDRTITRFGLGYSPDSWDALTVYLKSKGYTTEELKASGLVSVSAKDSNRIFDRFRNRVMFPIIDHRNNVIGFGGRTMTNDPAKYLNTSETLVFKKGKNLYALNYAKTSKRDGLILCEGYMDVISLHQAGIDNAVAALGTALTPDQARLIQSVTDNVYLCYDSDEAGQKATRRGLDVLKSFDVKTKVIVVTGGKDPDEFIKAYGKESFEKLLTNAQARVDYRIETIKRKYQLSVTEEKTQCLKEIIVLLATLDNRIEREIYIDRVAEDFGVTKENLTAEVNIQIKKATKYKRQKDDRSAMESLGKNLFAEGRNAHFKVMKIEDDIITLLLNFPQYAADFEKEISPDDFMTEFNKKVYELLVSAIKRDPTAEPLLGISQELSETEMGKLSAKVRDGKSFDVDRGKIRELASALKTEKNKALLQEVRQLDDDSFNATLAKLKNKDK